MAKFNKNMCGSSYPTDPSCSAVPILHNFAEFAVAGEGCREGGGAKYPELQDGTSGLEIVA